MNLFIKEFDSTGFLDSKIFQKEINRYMCIPYKSGNISHTIKNYICVRRNQKVYTI